MQKFTQIFRCLILTLGLFLVGCNTATWSNKPSSSMADVFLANFGSEGEQVLLNHQVQRINRHSCYGGQLVITNQGAYLFSHILQSASIQGYCPNSHTKFLKPQDYTTVNLLEKSMFVDAPSIYFSIKERRSKHGLFTVTVEDLYMKIGGFSMEPTPPRRLELMQEVIDVMIELDVDITLDDKRI